MIKILSIELTNKCSKACSFCYNASNVAVSTSWDKDSLINFINDCARNGVEVISFGGGEPLEYPSLIEVLEKAKGLKTLTTNGLLLNDRFIDTFKRTLTKLQISIHFPGDVDRVISQVLNLRENGLSCGVNLLVRASQLEWTKNAAKKLQDLNIPVIYLPMRVLDDEPSPEQVHSLTTSSFFFESVHCLTGCMKSDRFASIDFNHKVGWCSYTSERKEVSPLTFEGLTQALDHLDLIYCGESSRLALTQIKVKKKEKRTRIKSLSPVSLPGAFGHSTDTDWFALDACGHLANFWSSESGAVPAAEATTTIEGISYEYEHLSGDNVKEFLQTFDLPLPRHVKQNQKAAQAIFKVTQALTAAVIPALLSNRVNGKFFNNKLLLEKLERTEEDFSAIYTQFHKLCIACFGTYAIDFPAVVRQGVFYYRHPHWNGKAYPYRRMFTPINPIVTSNLHLPVFNSFCFIRKRNIQPTLYLPCNLGEGEEDGEIERENVIVDDGVLL